MGRHLRDFQSSSALLEETLGRIETASKSAADRKLTSREQDLADKLKQKQEVIDRARTFIGSWDSRLEALIKEKEGSLQNVSANLDPSIDRLQLKLTPNPSLTKLSCSPFSCPLQV